MNNTVLYFIESGIAMGLFYGLYRLFMEKETNYSLSRFYLAGTVILSLILPVLPLQKLLPSGDLAGVPVFVISGGDQGVAQGSFEAVAQGGAGWRIGAFDVARFLYLAGAVILVTTLLIQLIRLLFIRVASRETYGRMRILFLHRDIAPFSILNLVFVPYEIKSDPKFSTILEHESAHYRLLHFIDLILLEFISIFQWFNPLAWMYLRSLREIHEYQADAAVLSEGEGIGAYRALLVNQLTGTEVFRLSNGFSKSLTKKRMIMMTRMKSRRRAWMKVLLAMPVLAILMIAYAANSPAPTDGKQDYTVKGKVLEAKTGEPLPGVSVVWQGTKKGTSTDMEGNFTLHVSDKNAVVVYSFVGFQTVSTTGAGEFTVKMEQKIYEIPRVEKQASGTGSGEKLTKEQQEKEKQLKEEMKKEKLVKEKQTKDKITPEQLEKEKQLQVKMGQEGKSGEEKEQFYIVEDMPSFQGKSPEACREYLQEHRQYPEKAKAAGIQGIVLVQFVVGAKGQVKDAKVTRGVDPLLDKAALDAVNAMPAWEPGRQHGKPVAVIFEVPVEFKAGGN